MRKIAYLLLTFLVISSTACSEKKEKIKPSASEEEDNGKPHEENIVGKWIVSEFVLFGVYNNDGTLIDIYGITNEYNIDNYTIFNEDNTFHDNSVPMSMKFTYKAPFMKEVDVVKIVNSGLPPTGKWRINRDSLFIENEGNEEGYHISVLNSRRLRITSANAANDEGDFALIATFERAHEEETN